MNMMQQILGQKPQQSQKSKSQKKSSGHPTSSANQNQMASSMANLDFLKQQEQLLQASGLLSGFKPEQLMSNPELQALAAQVGYFSQLGKR